MVWKEQKWVIKTVLLIPIIKLLNIYLYSLRITTIKIHLISKLFGEFILIIQKRKIVRDWL